jgi:hypothetical protein
MEDQQSHFLVFIELQTNAKGIMCGVIFFSNSWLDNFLRSQIYYQWLTAQIYENNLNVKMKEQANEHTIHTNEHKMYLGKPNTRENPARR